MAPTGRGSLRRSQQPSEHVYSLGVRGRKTGTTLQDTGERDEHGMQPIDDIFSSPQKDDDSDGEADMDITTASGPNPGTLVKGQNSNRLPLPRSRSPIKTNLKSPAVRDPRMGPLSSPTRGSIVTSPEANKPKSVKRKLNFGAESTTLLPKLSSDNSRLNRINGLHNGYHDSGDEDEEHILHGNRDDAPLPNGDDSMQMVNGADDSELPDAEPDMSQEDAPVEPEAGEEADEEADEEAEEEAPVQPKRKGRPPKAVTQDTDDKDAEPVIRKRGRKPKAKPDETEPEAPSPKRRRAARDASDDENATSDAEPEKTTKRQRTEPKAAKGRKTSASEPTKRLGRPPKSSSAGADADTSMVVPRGPPLPRNKRGLLITRREVPGDGTTQQTRSGRASFKPLAWWRNEHVEYEQDAVVEDARGKMRFVLPAVKEVHRVEEEAPPEKKYRRGRPAARERKAARRGGGSDDDDDDDIPREAWETQDGEVVGEVALWRPEHEFNPPNIGDDVEVDEQQVAVSAAAIVTKEVRDAEFGFIKTLTTPFFGAGFVDMPPGSQKRPKNSRKMHLTFFVFTGRVLVSVGTDATFRIGKGGTWFVPRGNYYSITNDWDQDARIFFAQACEIQVPMAPLPEGDVDASARAPSPIIGS